MKTKHLSILAAAALSPLLALAQTPPAPPAPPAPAPPAVPPPPGRPHRDDGRDMPKVPVTFLGVETSEVPTVLCDQLGLPKGFGLVVDYVVPDGPAAAGGVQQSDIIKQINDQILTDPGQLGKLVRSYQEGASVTLTILRKGQEQKLNVKLTKKEVPRRNAWMGHGPGMKWSWNSDGWNGHVDLGDLKEKLGNLKEQLGDDQQGMIHDAIIKARDEMQRARDEMQRSQDQMNAQRDKMRTITRNNNGSVSRTTIDLGKAQIVFSDDKGELRVETVDGKKLLTAKDPQGKTLFSGPVETKEETDKLPPEVKQRFEQLQQNDLPAIGSNSSSVTVNSGNDDDNDADDDDDDEDEPSATNANFRQLQFVPAVQFVNQTFL